MESHQVNRALRTGDTTAGGETQCFSPSSSAMDRISPSMMVHRLMVLLMPRDKKNLLNKINLLSKIDRNSLTK